jgi:hypothetical protein
METRGVRIGVRIMMMTANVLGALLLHTQCAAREIHLKIHSSFIRIHVTWFKSRMSPNKCHLVQEQNVSRAPDVLSVTCFRYNCEGNGWAFQRKKHSRDVFRLQTRDRRPIYQQQSVAWENLSTGAAQSARTGGCGHVCVNGYASHKSSIPLATRPMTLMWQHASCPQGMRQGAHPGNMELATCAPLLSLSNDTPILFTCHASPLPSIFYQSFFTKSSRFKRSSNICGVPNIQQTKHSPHPDLS